MRSGADTRLGAAAKIHFEPQAIRELTSVPDVHRDTVVTDATMTRLGFVDRVTRIRQWRRGSPMNAAEVRWLPYEHAGRRRGRRLRRLPRPHRHG